MVQGKGILYHFYCLTQLSKHLRDYSRIKRGLTSEFRFQNSDIEKMQLQFVDDTTSFCDVEWFCVVRSKDYFH